MPNPIQAVASATSTSFPFTVTPFNVDLDGSGSSTTNLGATIVEYAWLLKDKPSGSGATVTQPSGIGSPVGRLEDIDLPGTYLLFLQVKDSTGAWSDAFLPAGENARVAITMTTEHRAWKIPARSERLWDDEMYTLLIGLDSLLGATLVDDTTIGFNGSTQLYVKNGGIGTTQLAALAVTAAKLGNDIAGNGLGGGNGSALSVNVDDATIEVNADTLRLKDAGVSTAKLAGTSVTAAKLGSDVAGNGLGGGNGTALSVNVDDTGIEINADTLRLKDAGVSTAKLAGTSVTAAKLGSDVAGSGLGGGNGTALSVNVDNSTIEINADTLRLKDAGVSTAKLAGTSVTAAKLGSDVAGSGLTGGNGSALAVDVDNSTITIVGGKLQANGTFNPDNVTLEVSSGTARVKDAGITLPKAGSGLFVDPGRPDNATIGLIGGGNFIGGETIALDLSGSPVGTPIVLSSSDDITSLAAIINSAPYSTYVRATVLGDYIDLVVIEPGSVLVGRFLYLDKYGTANANLVLREAVSPLPSGRAQVCGVKYRIEAFDVTRGLIIFDFNLTVSAVIVQALDGNEKVKEDWDGKVTWSGTQIKIENSTAAVTLADIEYLNVIAYGVPV